MATEERASADPLSNTQDLVADAWRRGFFPAVSLLERLTPGAPRVGGVGPVSEEAIRFRHDPSLTFSASDIKSITLKTVPAAPGNELGPTRHRWEVVTTFMGLVGAVTPLPLHIGEEVALEDPDAPAQRDFLDLFHHRLISLLYRLRGKYSYTTEYLSDQSDIWSKRILAMAGIDTFELPPNTRLSTWQLLRLAPLLAERSRTSQKLEIALADVLGGMLDNATLHIEQFCGRWVTIEERQRMKLAVQNTHLGKDMTLGARMQDKGGKFRVVIGPLHQGNFKRFTLGGEGMEMLKDVVGLFCRDELDYDLELVFGKDAGGSFRLATGYTAVEPSRLGKDTWVGRRQEESRMIVEVPTAIGMPESSGDPANAAGGADGHEADAPDESF